MRRIRLGLGLGFGSGLALVPSFEERFLAWQQTARNAEAPTRPRYLGCTEAAEVRERTALNLARAWPGGEVEEFWSVVGGLSGFDGLAALQQAQVPVRRLILFDLNQAQLDLGELMVALALASGSRDDFVRSLYGRSMEAFGRVLGCANMMDFLQLPVDPQVMPTVRAQLPEHLRHTYEAAFRCLARPAGWPVCWPCFGQRQALPRRPGLRKALRRLGGGKNEALHINEAGWLKNEARYRQLRDSLAHCAVEFRHLDLKDLPLAGGRRVVFISNIEGSPQFLAQEILTKWRCGARNTLLLSTERAEWLDGKE